MASGNVVQVPVNNCSESWVYAPVTVNSCGNTMNVVSTLNPAYGNSCAAEVDTADGS